MIKENILIIHDNKSSRKMIRYLLETEHFNVAESDSKAVLAGSLDYQSFHLIILDAGSKNQLVNDFVQYTTGKDIYDHVILLIPDESSIEERAFCQQLPISNQLQRPYSPADLLRVIRSSLNVRLATNDDDFNNDSAMSLDVSFDDDAYTITLVGRPVKMQPIEYNLFKLFYLNTNTIYSRDDLLVEVWGKEKQVEERTVDVHIRRLRKALQPFQLDVQLQTVHGEGYRFAEALVVV